MNIALLIDCENTRPECISGVLGELAEKGPTNVRRAYGNWKNQAEWEAKFQLFAIQPIQQFVCTVRTWSICAWPSMRWTCCTPRRSIVLRW